MDLKDVLGKLWAQREENVIITDQDNSIVYVSQKCGAAPEDVVKKGALMGDGIDEMEFFDIKLRVFKDLISSGGETFICYTFDDISDYTSLVKEISEYTKVISRVADFQSSIMKRLKLPYDTFLPGLGEYCGTNDVIMLMKSGASLIKSTYNGDIVRSVVSDEENYIGFMELKAGQSLDGYYCIASDETEGCSYSVILRKNERVSSLSFAESSIHNIISLFIENSIMRDKIIYESEHDKLTGLYNKGKYMSMKSQCFGRPETIAVLNFDVNNLKYINDTYGHELGDLLIINAAKSIAAVTSDKVMGFRVGGDEYVLVAPGVTREQAQKLLEKWQSALERINSSGDELYCAMACGMAFGEGDYDYDEVYARADSLMYTRKKEMKDNGICSHLKTG